MVLVLVEEAQRLRHRRATSHHSRTCRRQSTQRDRVWRTRYHRHYHPLATSRHSRTCRRRSKQRDLALCSRRYRRYRRRRESSLR